jgi:ComF family protein
MEREAETPTAPQRLSAVAAARLTGLGGLLVRLLLPPHCLACNVPVAAEGSLCAACWGRLRLIERPFCDRLALPFEFALGDGALSAEAIANPPPFGRLRAVALYEDIARQLVHGLKYRDHLELVGWMAQWMARAGAEVIATADIIVPVPLHPWRLWRRRFNQSAALAGAVAAATGRPAALQAVRRVRRTQRQVGLSATEREANVRSAFRVDGARSGEIAGRNVLLIDDVYTTGATARAVTRALKKAGASGVDVLVFARVARAGT